MERALVTGMTGFVGSHLTAALVTAGVEVHAIVRPNARLDRVSDLVESVTIHVDDGRAATMAAAVTSAQPDVTFHLATKFISDHHAGDVADLIESNVTFPARLTDALANAGAHAFVNAGTAWQHVDGASYRPKNLYAATKQAFEDLLRYYTDREMLSAVTVNLFDTYGPRDHRGKLLGALVAALRMGEPLDMGSGAPLVDLVHVDDVVAACLLAGEFVRREPASSEDRTSVYAVTSGRPRSVRDVVELLGAVAGRPVPVRWNARTDRAGEMLSPWNAGAALPDWTPSVTLEAGFAALLEQAAVPLHDMPG